MQTIGRYKIRHEIGQGALAVVYSASDPILKREVALKVLHPIFSKNRQNIERLKQEALTLAQLKHPNIIHIYEFIDEPEIKGIVTEYIQGQTLAQFLERHATVAPEISALIVADILSALEHAHSKKIIHRDIKPQNIIINIDGEIKLADFSIAKIMDKECLTLTGQLIGSPFFMSPEQANGGKIDERSDIFTTGILLYHLITGRLPFAGEDQKVILKKIIETSFEHPRKLNSEIPEQLENIVLKALVREKEKRYQKAWEFRYDLLKYLQHQEISDEDISLGLFFKNPDQFMEGFKSRRIALLSKKAKTAFEKQNYGEASEIWNRILDYDPNNREVHKELKKLSLSRGLKKAKPVAIVALSLLAIGGIALFLQPDREPLSPRPVTPASQPALPSMTRHST
ncbi:MAG: serine/threonine-protein kinase, partial [Deltaproteobacteria bacterium]